MRTDLVGMFTQDHVEATGNHTKVGLVQGNDDDSDEPALDGTLGFLYAQDIGGNTELHYKDDAGNVVIVTTEGVIAPLALLKAGDTMTGILLMDGGTIDFGNLTEQLRAEVVGGGGVFRHLASIDAADKILIGDVNEPLWLTADASGRPQEAADDDKGFIAIYPGGPNNERFWHEGNMGAASTLDADLLDGIEAVSIFSAMNLNESGNGEFFQSTGQSFLNGASAANIAHGIDGQPTLVTATAKCTDTDAEYAVDDEVALGSSLRYNDNRGVVFGADDTNCFYSLATQDSRILTKSGGVNVAMDDGKWIVIIRAWK